MVLVEDVAVMLVDLPTTIKGYTVRRYDRFTIVLNARLTREMNFKTYNHELGHIMRGDYDRKDESADMIEIFAHKED